MHTQPINYHNRRFRGVTNAENGEVDRDTEFHYRQDGHILWGTYQGGAIRFGTLCGVVRHDGRLDFRYSHVNQDGEIMTGQCISTPELLSDGRIRLYESWRWTSGDQSSGESQVEQF